MISCAVDLEEHILVVDYDGDGKSDFAKPSDAEAGMVWKNDGNTNPVNQDDYVDFE